MSGPIDLDRRGPPGGGWTRPTRFAAMLGGIAITAMMLHIFVDVVAKLFFNAPLQGTMEIAAYYYMVGIVFLPIAFTDWARQAITVDLFFGLFPGWLKAVAVLLMLCGMVFAYAGFAILSWQDAFAFMARREIAMGSGNVQVWPARFIMSAGLSLAAVTCAWQLFLFVSGRDRKSWLASELAVEE